MKIFENLNNHFERATHIQKIVASALIVLFTVLTPIVVALEKIPDSPEAPASKSLILVVPVPIVVQKPETVRDDKRVPSDVSPTAASTASFDKK